MKFKTALKQSTSAVKFYALFVAFMAAVAAQWTNGYSLTVLGLGVLHLLLDAYNIIYIKRKASHDPALLDRKMK